MNAARIARVLVRLPARPPAVLPSLTSTAHVRPDPERLSRYAAWLGVPDDTVPLPYLYVLLQPVHLDLLLDPRLSIPVLGMMHTGNRMELQRPIAPGADLETQQTLVEEAPLGGRRSLTVRSTLKAQGETVATAESRYVLRLRDPNVPKKTSSTTPTEASWQDTSPPHAWGANAGRRYAAVSGDYNPIHLYGPLARILGQRRAILHGMAMAAVAWREAGARAPLQEARFRRPLLLPGTAVIRHDPDGRFAVQGPAGTVHVEGTHA